MFCIPKQLSDKLIEAFQTGRLNPEKMNDMTSRERRLLLTDIIGEGDAKQVNLLFEKKLLLKNQEKAMYDWAKEVTGLSKEQKAETLEKIRKTYADKNRRLYEPEETEKFLNEITSDVYSKKYKTDVSLEEAQMITELSSEAKLAKEKMNDDFTFKSKQDALDYGAAEVALNNYTDGLKLEAGKIKLINPLKEKGVMDKIKSIFENAKISANFIGENSRALVASLDNSLWGRQGIRVLLDPRYSKIWANNFVKSWSDIYETLKGGNKAGDAILDAVKADVYSRPNYLNGKYNGKVGSGPAGTKLDVGIIEEAYPTSLPSKIPVLGRLFKASEVAYEAGAIRLRMDLADKVYKWTEKSGVNLKNNKEVGDLNEVVNGMTGRGTFGKQAGGFEKGANKFFFSIKFFKSNLDYLTLHQGRLSTPATKLAVTNLLYTVATTATIMGLAKALNPKDNKDIFNPKSSNFGKIKSGNMTIDLTHGAGGIVVLMAKELSGETTNSSTGITTKLGDEYGSQTRLDVLYNFIENKLSPASGAIRDILKGQNYSGEKPTFINESLGLITPISIKNIDQFKSEGIAKQILGLIADGIGLNTNVNTPYQTDWGQSTSKELQQFKQKMGDKRFNEANNLYNSTYNQWFNRMQGDQKFQALKDETKQTIITNKKSEIKNQIFKQYNFKYVAPKRQKVPKF